MVDLMVVKLDVMTVVGMVVPKELMWAETMAC
jgi:hypothetical protein